MKAAIDPGWGHYEIIGIGRFAHETIYPGVTTDSTKYGGQKDIVTAANVAAWFDDGRRNLEQHRSGRSRRKLPRSDRKKGELRDQGAVWTRGGPLRKHHPLRRDCQQLGRVVATARFLRAGHARVQSQPRVGPGTSTTASTMWAATTGEAPPQQPSARQRRRSARRASPILRNARPSRHRRCWLPVEPGEATGVLRRHRRWATARAC